MLRPFDLQCQRGRSMPSSFWAPSHHNLHSVDVQITVSTITNHRKWDRTKVHVLSFPCGLVFALWFFALLALSVFFITNFLTLNFLSQVDERALGWIIFLLFALVVGVPALATSKTYVVVIRQREECVNGVHDLTFVFGDLVFLLRIGRSAGCVLPTRAGRLAYPFGIGSCTRGVADELAPVPCPLWPI